MEYVPENHKNKIVMVLIVKSWWFVVVFVVETIRIFCDGFYCFFQQVVCDWTKQMQTRILFVSEFFVHMQHQVSIKIKIKLKFTGNESVAFLCSQTSYSPQDPPAFLVQNNDLFSLHVRPPLCDVNETLLAV